MWAKPKMNDVSVYTNVAHKIEKRRHMVQHLLTHGTCLYGLE